MPSASSKSEKTTSSEVVDPFSRAIIVVEHKIRNLEKRKSKLETYKESTKALTKEQQEAVSKYNDVLTQLELSREFIKNFSTISAEFERLKKKLAKKELQERYVAETGKVRLVLQMQDVLQNMGSETVREDFLAGRNGAVKLTEADLKALDDLYIEVSPKRLTEDGKPNTQDPFKKAAEYFMAIVEAKNKDLVGVPCARLKEILFSIHGCGYFDKGSGEEPAEEPALAGTTEEVPPQTGNTETPEEEEVEFQEPQEILTNVIVSTQNPPEGPLPPAPAPAPIVPVIPGAPIIPTGAQPPIVAPNQMLGPNVPIVPTPVSQVESSFFNAQGFKPPAPQSTVPPPAHNTRQINDVIQSVAGKFNFLQESELEINELNSGVVQPNPPVPAPQVANPAPSAIPTRTFTNQNFNGQPAGGPTYPPTYPPQPAAFQNFVPGFPGFVAPNTSPTPTNNANSNDTNSNNSTNNNIPTPIPLPPTRNPNVSYNQNHQQIPSTTFTPQASTQPGSQPPSQPSTFQHGNINVAPVDNKIEDTVRPESERKEKSENDFKEWNQRPTGNWADDMESNEWNPQSSAQGDGRTNRSERNGGGGGGGGRNTNGYQGNRNRTNRQGGFRDSQNNQGGNNYYQNQNGYQSRNDRNNEYSGKGNPDFRDNTYKERGDFNRDNRDGYGGGGRFKGGNSTRGSNMKGPLDRSDRQGQAPRNNNGGPRPPRNNMNRQPGGGNGPSYQRHQPNPTGQPK